MGFWLMPATEHQSYMITFPREEDLEHIVEIIRPLAQKRMLGNIPQLRHVIQELACYRDAKGSLVSRPWPDGPREYTPLRRDSSVR